MSWFFNNNLLLMHKLQLRDDQLTISLNHAVCWIQIYDLPSGLMSKTMTRWFGSFLGEFLEYNTKISSLGLQRYMQIKARLDVRLALKQKRRFNSELERIMLGSNMKNSIFFASFMVNLDMGKVFVQ
ncbi:hypothetical protein J1N35_043168 [Gossypium stocksii]|uniref:DUF4283 domain-containing protein n=1 Tax=Gossypium stocksii TaxID=47602 RepID=A0A9D3ZER5_9ROSI|nr:hypothetical protein J1N35_043168 [Gossypium stocksii]